MTTSELGLSGVDARLEARVRRGLDAVEGRLASSVSSDTAFLSGTARHLLEAGGKRFRPLLVLLGAQLGDPEAEDIVPAALVVELTHVATLYHDDVMDEATLRRGAQSANARWNNTVAILTGDYLFARASTLVADLGPACVKLQSETFARLVEGQLRETLGPGEGADPLDHYLAVVRDKTASLIATSVRLGAMVAGVDADVEQVLTAFGEKIGIAFQLSDDVLDVASEAGQSGKTPGTDLREGVATLPVLLALRSVSSPAGPGDGERLQELLLGDLTDDARLQEALRLLRAHPALEEARAEVRRWSDEARALLVDGLPASPARTALEGLCDMVVTRTT